MPCGVVSGAWVTIAWSSAMIAPPGRSSRCWCFSQTKQALTAARLPAGSDDSGSRGRQVAGGDEVLLGGSQAGREAPAVEVGASPGSGEVEPLTERGVEGPQPVAVVAELGDDLGRGPVGVAVDLVVEPPLGCRLGQALDVELVEDQGPAGAHELGQAAAGVPQRVDVVQGDHADGRVEARGRLQDLVQRDGADAGRGGLRVD